MVGSAGYGLGGEAAPGATYAVVGRGTPGGSVPPWRDEAATRCFLQCLLLSLTLNAFTMISVFESDANNMFGSRLK